MPLFAPEVKESYVALHTKGAKRAETLGFRALTLPAEKSPAAGLANFALPHNPPIEMPGRVAEDRHDDDEAEEEGD